MTIHWPTSRVPTDRIAAIRAVYTPGVKSSQLAKLLGVTRCTIKGMYRRFGESELADCPLENGRYDGGWHRHGQAIREVYRDGDTMGDLAKKLGVTRNAVAGVYDRCKGLRADCPLPVPCQHPSRLRPRRPATPKLLAKPPAPITAPHGAGRTLMMLQRHQCKWAVNEAAIGEQHLFCGMPAEGSYCEHHKARAFRPSEAC